MSDWKLLDELGSGRRRRSRRAAQGASQAAEAKLEKILTEAGMDVRVDMQHIESGEQWHGRPTFRVVRTL